MLETTTFSRFSGNSIKPQGWLRNQLQIQADGLSGHLDKFWPDIKDSAWLGGTADGWERLPYWLDGVIPMAWLLDDNGLKDRLNKYIDYIISHQSDDGWLGPRVSEKPEAADYWSQFLTLKMFVEYFQFTEDSRVPNVVSKALKAVENRINYYPLSNWGQFRWFEALIPIFWLYERVEEDWLLSLATKLKAQGFDWQFYFLNWPEKEATPKGVWTYASHVVNNAMAIKSGALWSRVSKFKKDKKAADQMMKLLDQ
jgi:hypothetical protein